MGKVLKNMATVVVKQDETIDQAISRFRTKCRREGLFERKIRYYEKPSEIRHRLDQQRKKLNKRGSKLCLQ